MTLTPDGGAAIPVSVTTTRKVQGGSAIPVYGYTTAPTDGRPAMGGPALPVRVLTAADLKENGGQWTLEGRPHAMPVYTAPAGATVMGGPALAVYPVNAWPTVAAPVDTFGTTLLLYDTFTDADGTILSTHTIAPTSGGKTWTDNGLPLQQQTINSNRMGHAPSGDTKYGKIDLGVADYMVEAKVICPGADAYRATYLEVRQGAGDPPETPAGVQLNLTQPGVIDLLQNGVSLSSTSKTAWTADESHVFQIWCRGSAITVKMDGATILTGTAAATQTNTRVGVSDYNFAYDDFKVYT